MRKEEIFNSTGLVKSDRLENMWCPVCKTITAFTEWLDSPGGYLKGVICDNCGKNLQMKEPAYYMCHVYKAVCKCGKEKVLLTQKDNNPEYYAEVGLICECDEVIWFELPVN